MYLTKATEHKLIRLDNDKDRWNNPRGGYVAKKAEGKGQQFEIWKGESPLYSFSIFHLKPRVRAGARDESLALFFLSTGLDRPISQRRRFNWITNFAAKMDRLQLVICVVAYNCTTVIEVAQNILMQLTNRVNDAIYTVFCFT